MKTTNNLSQCPECTSRDIATDDFNLGPNNAQCVRCEAIASRAASTAPWHWTPGQEIREARAEIRQYTYRLGTPEGDL